MKSIVVITFSLFRRFLDEETSAWAWMHIFKTEVIATVLFGKCCCNHSFVVLDVCSLFAPFVTPPQIVSSATSWMLSMMRLCGRSSKVCLTDDVKGFRLDKHSYGFK